MEPTDATSDYPTQPLTYAPPRRRMRRPIMWTMIGLFLVIVTLPLTVPAFRAADEHLKSWKMQRACATFSPSPETMVYANGNGYDSVQLTAPFDRISHPVKRDYHFGLSSSHLDAIQMRAGIWPDFMLRQDALLFLGERRTPDGRPTIVGVEMACGDQLYVDSAIPPLRIATVIIRPAGFFSRQTPGVSRVVSSLGYWPMTGPTRFYAGQPDPVDASRFTIVYVVDDQPGVIDGVVNDDLTVTLTVRDGPLLKRSKSDLP